MPFFAQIAHFKGVVRHFRFQKFWLSTTISPQKDYFGGVL